MSEFDKIMSIVGEKLCNVVQPVSPKIYIEMCTNGTGYIDPNAVYWIGFFSSLIVLLMVLSALGNLLSTGKR